jgi:pyruvate/2-oxoglutarate/acetoin dehydrogenase E1 component
VSRWSFNQESVNFIVSHAFVQRRCFGGTCEMPVVARNEGCAGMTTRTTDID